MDPNAVHNMFLYGNPSGNANPNPNDGTMLQDHNNAATAQQQNQQMQQQQQQQQNQQQNNDPNNSAGGQQQQQQQHQQMQQDAQQQMAQQQMANFPGLLQAYLVQQQQQMQQQQQQQQAAAAMADRRLSGLPQAGMSLAGGAPPGGGFPGLAGMPAAAFFPQAFNPNNPGNFGAEYMDTNRLFLQRLQGAGAAVAGGGNQSNNWIGDMSGAGDPYAENGILGPWSATSAGLLGKMAVVNQDKAKKIRRKPKDKPKRPLSAYNIFFKEERARILEEIPEGDGKSDGSGGGSTGKGKKKRKKTPHGKIGFENLAKVIGQRWQELTPDQVEYYKEKASGDMKRYKDEMEMYLAKQDGPKKEGSGQEGALADLKEEIPDNGGEDEEHFHGGHEEEEDDDEESAVKKVKLEETAV